jgi:thymidylate synthase (FAD)
MRIVYSPEVYLICRPKIDWGAVEDFLCLEHGGANWKHTSDSDGDLIAEFMGRMCYGSFGGKQGRTDSHEYLANVMSHGHGSVLEHATYSFVVSACSRGYTHQMVRHRAGFAFSQESTHFIKYDNDCTMCMPGCHDMDPAQLSMAGSAFRDAVVAYSDMMGALEAQFAGTAHGKKKALCGTARNMLPIALQSRLGFTANCRALRHFIELRGAPENTVEIRMVAAQVAEFMRVEAQCIFPDVVIYTAEDGFPAVRTTWRKV